MKTEARQRISALSVADAMHRGVFTCEREARLSEVAATMVPRWLAETDVAASRAQLDASLAKVPDVTPAMVAIFGGASLFAAQAVQL